MNKYEISDIRGYCFKRRFFYIGWLTIRREPVMLYADNNPYMTIVPEYEIGCVIFGLTTKSVIRRLTKKAKKIKEVNDND